MSENSSLQNLFKRVGQSPLSEVLQAPARVVAEVQPPAPEPEPVPQPEHNPNTPVEVPRSRYEDEDEWEDENRRLEPEEVKAMAEAKAMKFGVFIEMATNIFNSFAILSPADRKVYHEYERDMYYAHVKGYATPVYESSHPIHKVLKKMEKLDRMKENSALSPEQKKTLEKAAHIELKVKNKNGRLKSYGIWGATGDIVVSKTGDALSDVGLRLLDKILERINR